MQFKYIMKTLICILCILILFNMHILADDEDIEDELDEIKLQEITMELVAEPTDEPIINAKAAIIYDRLILKSFSNITTVISLSSPKLKIILSITNRRWKNK